jgi:hypothetical protein
MLSHCYLICVLCSLLCFNPRFIFFYHSFCVCFLVAYVLLYILCVLCFCIVLCIVYTHECSCLFSICIQVYGPLSPGGNPFAVNKYYIT